MPHRLGVDIGGTFTDAMLIDEDSGSVSIMKVQTTPSDPETGFLSVTARILAAAGVPASEVRYVVHGTTVATNAIIEGKMAPTGFVTTEGFSDMLEIQRQIRPSLYDLQFQKPVPLVPRRLSFGVRERLDATGAVIIPLDETHIAAIGAQLRDAGVEAVAVCLLHSYAHPDHEKRVGEVLGDLLPDIPISLSAELVPEFREYARASTTVINASIMPIVASYLERIEARLRAEGVQGELLVMQSGGGVYPFEAAAEKPVFMVESGPAAGVIAAAHIGDAIGFEDVISFDMGGTTAKAGLVQNGTPRVTKEFQVGAEARVGSGIARGQGYPILTPVIDLVEVGAGGGSIAWLDSGGALRVGPQSAGAVPGPACYGQGGDAPTVTDANLVLGRLNPDYFLGGEISLDIGLATRAIEERCARPLDLTLDEAAYGILEIANHAMVNALRIVSVQRGYDPRDFALVAFGGAGPLHACWLADELGVETAVIPTSPGITSAMGLLVSDFRHEYTSTVISRLDDVDREDVGTRLAGLKSTGRETLLREGISEADIRLEPEVDLRYVGQSFELGIAFDESVLGPRWAERLANRFHDEHDRVYGFSDSSEPVEMVNLRVVAVGEIQKPGLMAGRTAGTLSTAVKSTRRVFFAESGGSTETTIYDRYALPADTSIDGPAVVEEIDSTTVVHPGWTAEVDLYGNLLLRRL